MPYTHSIHLNIPNANNSMPAYAQTPIPMNPLAHLPGQIQMQPQGYLPMNPYEYSHSMGRLPFVPPGFMGHNIIINKPTKNNIITSTGDIGNIKYIYEDLLPKNATFYDRYATISERLNIANYNSLIFKKHYFTGESSTIQEKIDRLDKITEQDETLTYLLSHIKITSINTNQHNTSYLHSLPGSSSVNHKHMIIFNVCNPIQYNDNQITCRQKTEGVENDDGSIQSHLRIYRVTNTTKKFIEREYHYYNLIRNLIKNKRFPNFVLSYGEFFSHCKIDFDGMSSLNDFSSIPTLPSTATNGAYCLLMLTEGVTRNIEEWATRTMKAKELSTNPDKDLIIEIAWTGYKHYDVWKSVIFQLIVAIYILHKENIKFNFDDFTLKENVFMKKINISPPVKYWKYIINGAQYYVPNKEWLVMINSSEKFTKNILDKSVYNISNEIILRLIIKLLLEIRKFESIPDEIQTLIDDIVANVNRDIKNYEIESIFAEHFSNYLYEKIGTIISNTNTNEYMLLPNYQNFKIGDIVLFIIGNNIFSISNIKSIDTTKNNNNIEIMTSDKNYDIHNYNENSKLIPENVSGDQIIKFRYNSTKEVIETYNINY
jgi:hypothetical protein